MDAGTLPSFSAFTRNGYVQQARGKKLRYGNFRCDVYLFPSEGLLHDSIIYSYNWSLSIADNGFAEATEVVALNVETVRDW